MKRLPWKCVIVFLLILALQDFVAAQKVTQPAPQNPSPMVDSTRPHPRIVKQDTPGKEFVLSTGTLYLSQGFRKGRRIPLIVHFHGAPWVMEHFVRKFWPQAALIAVQLGAGSGIYARAFGDDRRFGVLLEEAASQVKRMTGRAIEFDPIILTSFSAGYGAIRTILMQPGNFDRVDAVFLADSLHTSYVPEGTPGKLDEGPLEIFCRYAQDAAARKKVMWVTNSEVFPGTFASTTETTDFLSSRLHVKRKPLLRHGPIGMQQLSEVRIGNFRLMGFAGNSAPDHMDHLYAMGEWLKVFKRSVRP